MQLVALHKVLGLAHSPALALYLLLLPLVTANLASKIRPCAFSQGRKSRSCTLMHSQKLRRVRHGNFMSDTSCLLGRGGGTYMLGTSAYPCGGFCRVHGAFWVSSWQEREHRCPKRGRLAWIACDSETSSQVREMSSSRVFQASCSSQFVLYN